MEIPNFAEIKWSSPLTWHFICESEDVPLDDETGSSAVFLAGDTQIAVYRFPDNKVYASQNMCGHRRAFILSEGILETDADGQAHVACPIHRRKFALTGENAGYTNRRNFQHTIATFEAKEEDGRIYLKLPEIKEMDQLLGTQRWATSSRQKPPSFIRDIGSRRPPVSMNDDSVTCAAIDSRLTW